MNGFDVKVEFSADVVAALAGIAKVQDRVSKLESQTDSTAQGMDRLSAAMGKTAHYGIGLFAVLPALQGMVRGAVDAADAVTTLQSRLLLATGTTAAAARAYDSLYAAAQQSRASFTELGGVYATLSRAGVANMAVVQAIGNAMAIGGGSAESMKAALVQLGQGMASGVLRGQELNSVMEQAPRLAQALADGLGVPIGQLRTLAEAGSLTTKRVTEALANSAPRLAEEMARSGVTVGQAFTVLGNATTRFVGDADKASGATKLLGAALTVLAGTIDTAGEVIRKHETAFAVLGGVLAGLATIAGIGKLASGLTILGGAVATLGAVLLANPAVLALLGLGAIAGGAVAFARASTTTADGIERAIASLKQENERSEEALKRAEAGGRTAGASNIRLTMQGRLDEMRKLNAELALLQGAGADTSAEDARLGEHTRQYKEQNEAMAALAAAKNKLAGVDAEYAKTVAMLADNLQRGNIGYAEYVKLTSQAHAATAIGKAQTQAAAEALKAHTAAVDEELKRLMAGAQARSAARQAESKAIDEFEAAEDGRRHKEVGAAAAAAAAAKLEFQTHGLLRSQIAELTLQRLQDKKAAFLAGSENAASVQREIDAQLELIGILRKGETRDAVDASAKSTAAEWKRTTDTIEASLTDALMRGFEGGRGFIDSFTSTLKSAFKTLVLQPTIRAILAPSMGSMGSMLSGGAQAAGGAGGAGGGSVLGGLGSMGSMLGAGAQMGMSGWGGFSASMQGAGSMIGGGEFGAGLSQGAGTLAGFIGPALIGRMVGQSIGGGFSLNGGSGNSTINAGMVIGAIFGGPIGAGIGAAIGGVVNRAFGMGGREDRGSGVEGTAGSGGFSGSQYSDWSQKGGWFRKNKSGRDWSTVGAGAETALDQGISLVYAAAGDYAKALGLPVNAVKDFTAQFKVAWGASEEENKKAVEAALVSLSNQLAGVYKNKLEPLQRAGESLSETLTRLAGLQTFSDSLAQLGGVFFRVATLGVDARESMIALAGGMEQFSQQAMGFVQNYYSRDEIAGLKAREIKDALGAVGITQNITGTDPRAQFRALVDGVDVGTEAGRKQLATLLGVADSFTGVADYLTETGGTLNSTAAGSPALGTLGGLFASAATQQVTATNGVRDAVDRVADILIGQQSGQGSGRATIMPVTRWEVSP